MFGKFLGFEFHVGAFDLFKVGSGRDDRVGVAELEGFVIVMRMMHSDGGYNVLI